MLTSFVVVVKLSKVLIDCYLEEIKRLQQRPSVRREATQILFSKRLSYDVRSCFHNGLD